MKRYLAILLAACMIFAFVAACGGGDDAPAAPPAADTPADTTADAPADAPPPVDPGEEPYEFVMLFNYDWAGYQNWGDTLLTQYWDEMFNVRLRPTKPDANADEMLNLRIASDDLPDAIWMDRGDMSQRMARMGLFVPIDDMKAMVNNTWYDDYVSESTANFYKIDGVNYTIPNWARKGEMGVKGGATGGNNAWLYTTKVYEAVGSPEIKTFDDLYNYVAAVRDANLENYTGSAVIPLLFNHDNSFGVNFVNQAIYPTFGGTSDGDWFYGTDENQNYSLKFRIPLWREAVLEANAWYRAGLFPDTNMSESGDDFQAKLNTGRGGLIWYDQSQDEAASMFRKILREGDPGNSIEMFVAEDPDGWKGVYPPAYGLQVKDIYHHVYDTLGWNQVVITTAAEHPDKIFNLMTWMLTLQGSIEMMYGPPGYIYDEIHPDGYPIIHTPESMFTAEELDHIGGWQTNFIGASNHWDDAKFAADAALPLEHQSWVITNQREIFTPNMMLSNEYVRMNDVIDPTSDIGINRRTIHERFEETFPLILMASSRAEATQLMDDFIAFAEANGVVEIEAILNDNYQSNKLQQGGFGLRPMVLPEGFTPRD